MTFFRKKQENCEIFTEKPALVLDFGSGSTKVGISGEKSPRFVEATLIGRPKFPSLLIGGKYRDSYTCDQINEQLANVKVKSPIQHGMVCNYNDFEKIMHYMFYEKLKTDPSERRIAMNYSFKTPSNCVEKNVCISFETFNVPGILYEESLICSASSNGQKEGIYVDIGEGVTQLGPYQSSTNELIRSGLYRSELCGILLTEYLNKILSERGYYFETTVEKYYIVKKLKEKLCYVSLDFDEEMKDEKISEFELPDLKTLKIGNEKIRIPEIFFNTSSPGYSNYYSDEIDPIQKLILKSIKRSNLKGINAIFVSGGTGLMTNFSKRLQLELNKVKNQSLTVTECVEHSVWVGSSVLSSLSSAKFMSKEQYDDLGPAGLLRKFDSKIYRVPSKFHNNN